MKNRMFKKIVAAGAVLTLAFSLCLTGCGNSNKKTLKVYNAGEYIDKTLLTKFEKQYDCKVLIIN